MDKIILKVGDRVRILRNTCDSNTRKNLFIGKTGTITEIYYTGGITEENKHYIIGDISVLDLWNWWELELVCLKRKAIRKEIRRISAEVYCVPGTLGKELAEQLDALADKI